MEKVIQVDGLIKRYGSLVAVDGISFHVEKGEIFGLLGENGAGKTTTLEILEGLRRASSGEMRVLGFDVQRDVDRIKNRIGVQLQASAYYNYLSLREILDLFGSFYDKSVDPDALLRMVGLQQKAGSYVSQLSGGQRQRFSIVASLVNDPEVVFLDEPTTGLDPMARRSLWEMIAAIKARGKTVLLTTHYMEEAEILCDRVAIMDKGRIVAQDQTSALMHLSDKPFKLAFTMKQGVDGLLERLEALGEVVTPASGTGRYEMRISTQGNLNAAIQLVSAAGPEGFTAGHVSLEDVFIRLVGKSIAEDATVD